MRESITRIRRVIVSRRSRSGTATTEKKQRKEDKKTEHANLLRYVGSNHSTLRMLYLFFLRKYP